MLSLTLSANLVGSYNSVRGLVSGAGSLSPSFFLALTDGTGASQADGLFTWNEGISANETQSFGLFSGLVDLYGQTLEFSAVKAIFIQADPNNEANILIGGGTWVGPFGDASNTLVLRPGQMICFACQDANGYPVDPSADILQVQSIVDAAYSLTIVGVSTAVSPPICAARPHLLASPQVGVELDCYDGDWSGNPTFTYQWKRGGVAIMGATASSYTPVQSDVGMAISRSCVASNSAGSVNASSDAVVCRSTGILDFSDPANSGLAL
jgi:hypothetical protein